VCVFAPTGGVYWGPRSSALVESPYTHSFVAPVTGWYAVVVVSDGGYGEFHVAVYNGNVAVDEPRIPDRDAFRTVSPNPGRGDLRFDYAVRGGGEVAFEMLDMAGRMVSRYAVGTKSPGVWSEAWRATDAAGRALPPGMYFVRMRLGERVVGQHKVTLLQ
jgi:hypothetical protein